MIFRTINADAKKLTEQFGLLNKSFRDIKKDFANGLGFKNSLFQTSISKTDYQALQKFNSAIKVTNDGLTKSQRITKAWNENMTGCSIAAKRMGNDLVTGKKNIQDISKAMNTASGSTKALGVAMNVMANVGFMLAITAITKVISELAQAQDNAAQAAKEATETYKSELNSIADYKQRLSELHAELKSGNLSYEETKTKRTELMTIQDELIEKFGNEKGAIESVTEAVNGQVDALDDLNEKAYRDWVAKADEQTFWNKLLPGGKSGLDQAIDYMESEKTVSFMDMQNANLSDELQAIQKEIDETIRAKYNLDKTFAMFNVTGTPDELRTQLENIRQDYADISKEVFEGHDIYDHNLWEEYRKETTDSINEAITSLDKGLEKHQDTYKTYIEGLIKYDSDYSDEYANILQKRAELESAQNSGNAEEVKKAKQEFMDSINDAIIASDSDENIKKYFESLYPELQSEFDNWAFEFDLEVNKDGIADAAKEIGEKYSATDLLNMVNTEGVQEGEKSFNSLIDKAIEYGVCTDKSAEEVQKLIDLLVELGIVQGEIVSDTESTALFSSFDGSEIGERLQYINSQFEAGELTAKEYFDALRNEIENVDFSKLTDSLKEANAASQQFFTDSVQQTASGLSDLINKFDSGSIGVSEYLEGYLSIAETMSTLTDELQKNSEAWDENGNALSSASNSALDSTQENMANAISVIQSYQDSIYSLEQIMTGAIEAGSNEFAAHAEVIADDLARIVATGGEMADEVSKVLGTTTDEIAESLTESVSNQSLASQAIAANTNTAIGDMANSIGELFDTLGNAISHFKVDVSFGIKKISAQDVDMGILGTHKLPKIEFALEANGQSLDAIGSAISSFGKTISSNLKPQMIELPDFTFGNTEAGKKSTYKPSSGITKNYEDAYDKIKDAAKDASKSAKDSAKDATDEIKNEFEELIDFFDRRNDVLNDALSLLKTNLDNVTGSFAKNKLIDAELGVTEEKFKNYSDALNMYTQKANEALSKLPSDIASKIKDGAVDLTTFIGDGNKEVVEAIKDYEQWADKVADCKQELAELRTAIRQLELEKFNNIMEEFSNQFDLHEDGKDLISKQADLLKEAGELLGESFFTTQIDQSKKQLALLEEEKAKLVGQMESAIGFGRVD